MHMCVQRVIVYVHDKHIRSTSDLFLQRVIAYVHNKHIRSISDLFLYVLLLRNWPGCQSVFSGRSIGRVRRLDIGGVSIRPLLSAAEN